MAIIDQNLGMGETENPAAGEPVTTEAESAGNPAVTQTTPAMWRARIDACRRLKRELIMDWQLNVDYRRGKQFTTESDQDRIGVNKDWPNTKAKQAALFSAVPQVTGQAKREELKPATAAFVKALNEELDRAKVGVAMDETMPDVINAAGIGSVICGYESRTRLKKVPKIDLAMLPPEILEQLKANNFEGIPTEDVPEVVSRRPFCKRISPSDMLWDTDFAGSDFDDSTWVGRSGRCSWSQGKDEFKLRDDQKSQVVKADSRTDLDRLVTDVQNISTTKQDQVNFHELFYWAYRDDPEEKYFECIHRIVFVDGLEEPVIDEKWTGQKFDEQAGVYLGATKFPIRYLTLTYLSDECIPPSDSAVGRPQVDEMIRSRTQMLEQRLRSMPIRGFDVNRIDPAIQESLMRGTWQGMIPVQGNGQAAIWEVSRAAFPQEDFAFDKVANDDLSNIWQISPNQAGAFNSGDRSASEANIVQENFQTRVSYERARVAKFFLGIAEVMGGLMSLFGNFATLDNREKAELAKWNPAVISMESAFKIRPDSTVLLDSGQRIQKLLNVLNMTAQSGFINPEPLVREIIELSGLDPEVVMVKPVEKGPEPVNISVRNAEDLLNPIFLSLLVKSDQAPSPADLNAAINIIREAMKSRPNVDLEPPKTPEPDDHGGQPQPEAGVPAVEPENAQMEAMPRVTKRADELGG